MRHYPTMLHVLLPRLTRLVVTERSRQLVAAALLGNTTLRELMMHISHEAFETDLGARDALYASLRMTRVRSVQLSACYFEHFPQDGMADLVAACNSLPATVEHVELDDCSSFAFGAAAGAHSCQTIC